jgi:CheY-like chemotaxis protein
MAKEAPRILVVDDDGDVRQMLFLALVEEGYAVDVADSGIDAMALAMSERPAVVLLDLGLPDIGGAEVGRRLRYSLGRTVRIIVLSAADGIAQYAATMRADAYVAKPFDLADFLATVRRVLAQAGGVTLRWDAATNRFLGERIAVSLQAYDAMVKAAMAEGMDILKAYQRASEEEGWDPGIEGVEVLGEPLPCLHCGRALPARHGKFCDVVCEAGFDAEARS